MSLLRRVRPAEPADAGALAAVLDRSTTSSPQVEAAVHAIVDDVRARGDAAVRELTERFDKRAPGPDGGYEIDQARWDALAGQVAPRVREALEHAAARIRAFHARQVEPDLLAEDGGVRLGLRVTPLARVGLYVPGGTARYPSSVLMTAIPAKVAGVGEVVMVTPGPSPETLLAAKIAGVDRVFEIGGAQAVAALAYGTATVPRVDKIVGPGNQWVAVAKRIVFGEVDIDAVAGPSEVLILADATANPAWIAADLLAQAEHDVEARAILVTTAQGLLDAVDAELARQLAVLPREKIARAALDRYGAAIVVDTLEQAVAFANRYAPEHLEVQCAAPREVAARLTTSGAIFVGAWASEATGDYLAGANHVLPTGGAARYASPLGTYDFRKRTSLVEYDEAAARAHAADIAALAEVEGLDAHGRSAVIRTTAPVGAVAASSSPAGNPLAELVTPALRGERAYHVPRPALIRAKLDANESPYALPPDVAAALGAELAKAALERYPYADAGELRPTVARQLGVAPDRLVFGNGSDELIAMLCAAFAAPRPGAARAGVLYPWPTFVYYRIAAKIHGLDAVEVALRDDFTMDEAEVDAAVAARRPNVAFFALPSNPTGTLWSVDYVLDLARRYPDMIVVSDEAYLAYGGRTVLPELAALPNLVVMRTLSKVGMAGLRCGFLVAHPDVVHELEKVRPPYNLNSLTQRAAAWLLEHHGAALEAHARAVVDERARLVAGLRALPGLRVFDTEANFVMIRVGAAGDGRATAVWRALMERGILVRTFDAPGAGPLAGCLRVTVGTPAEDDLLLSALRELLP